MTTLANTNALSSTIQQWKQPRKSQSNVRDQNMLYFLKNISAILPHSSAIIIVFVIKAFAGEKKVNVFLADLPVEVCFVEKSVVKCQPTLPLISCYCRAVSQVQGCMVNNRNVSTLVSPLNHLFTALASLFRPRHQFKPLWNYRQKSRGDLGSDSPDWCLWRLKGLLDKGKSNLFKQHSQNK